MELISIRQVSFDYGISRQMLYYYEEIGLIKSIRQNNYTYRFYDEDAIKRIQQIIILRKLQIPMKQIKDILNNQNAVAVIEIFKQNIRELDEQITALSVVKSILKRLVDGLQENADIHLKLDLLNDKTMLAVNSLSFSENKINNVKGNVTMETIENLNKANETLNKLKDRDVRIIYLPPMTVAVARGLTADEKTEKAPANMLVKFIRESGLLKIKPDARCMMANKTSKEILKDILSAEHDDIPPEEYEFWVTIPDDMEVPAPLIKKTFEGGLYATYLLNYANHLLKNGIYDDSRSLVEWVNASDKYEPDIDNERPSFMEILNFYNVASNYDEIDKRNDIQSDIMYPIKIK